MKQRCETNYSVLERNEKDVHTMNKQTRWTYQEKAFETSDITLIKVLKAESSRRISIQLYWQTVTKQR